MLITDESGAVIPVPEGISRSRGVGRSNISADHEHIHTSTCGPIFRLRSSDGDNGFRGRFVLPNGYIRSGWGNLVSIK